MICVIKNSKVFAIHTDEQVAEIRNKYSGLDIIHVADSTNVTLGGTDPRDLGATWKDARLLKGIVEIEDELLSHLAETAILTPDIISCLRLPKISKEIFTLPTGVNEFCLLYEEGHYHLFYDDKTQTKYRRATTLEGLKIAEDLLTFTGKYPWSLYEDKKWHLWVWDNSTLVTKHYTANQAEGSYVYSDDCLSNKGDWAVTRNPNNGKYYAAYKDAYTLYTGVAVADTLNGPWTDLGYVFADGERTLWHSGEEADASIFFFNGKAYLLFAGWDNEKQRIGIVELDTETFKAKGNTMVLVNPDEAWHTRNSMSKVFSPVFLQVGQEVRIFYSQNPSAAVEAGWGYIEATSPLLDTRRKTDIARVDCKNGHNIATNIQLTKIGTPSFSSDGIVLTTTPSGLYGSTALGKINDFTLVAEINISDIPDSYARVFAVTNGISSGNVIGLWINSSSKVYYELIGSTSELNLVGTSNATLSINTPYRIVLRKYGDEVKLIINGVVDTITNHTETIDATGYCEIGFSNLSGIDSQQFLGTIKEFFMVAEAMPLSLL